MEVQPIDKLVDLLKNIKENFVLANEQDIVTLITGYEGSGKSLLAYYLGSQLDPNFSLDRIPFSLKEYFKIERKWASDGWRKKRGSVLVFDEGGSELLSRNYMDKEQKKFVSDMIRNRYMCLFRFICVPKPKYIDVYIREERVQNVLYTYYDLDDDYGVKGRYVAIITNPSWSKLLGSRNWKRKFYSSHKLLSSGYVDQIFKIPNLKEKIPRGEIRKYLRKKVKGHQNMIEEEEKSKKIPKKKRPLFWKWFGNKRDELEKQGKSETEKDKIMGEELDVTPRRVRGLKKEFRKYMGKEK